MGFVSGSRIRHWVGGGRGGAGGGAEGGGRRGGGGGNGYMFSFNGCGPRRDSA